LRIVDARLDGPSGSNLISAPAARIDLSLGALLSGRVAPEKAVLAVPTMTLDLDRSRFTPKGGLTNVAILASALGPLTGLSLSDGVLRVVSQGRGVLRQS